jgi:transcriptional regulator with XRE-family HTH domain
MARRSLQLRSEYRDEAKERLKKMNLTQSGLGAKADIYSAATVNNFFRGKPVDRGNFNKLCDLLGFEPLEVGVQPSSTLPSTDRQAVNPNSNICRSGEKAWYQMLLEEHSLIRLHAPAQFGKTLLMSRMLHHAEQQGHLSLYVTLNGIAAASFSDAPTFFRNFICEIVNELEDSNHDRLMLLDEYDRHVQEIGHFKATVKYLEYFQKNISQPFMLGINKLDRLLDDPLNAKTASEFLYLLRYMNERSKAGKAWKQFRLILTYSALRFEDSIPIVTTQSPFNVGCDIDLPEFTPSEIAELAVKKGLSLDKRQIQLLMKPIGGIPILVQLTLNTLRERGEHLLEDSAAISSIYQDHLDILASYLGSRDLASTIKQIAINKIEDATLDNIELNLLYRRGLIVITNDRQVLPRCELYRHFFA